MRKLLLIGTALTVLMACKDAKTPEVKTVTVQETPTATNDNLAASYAKAEFTIEGMTCAVGCAATIEKNLAKMEGVKTAKVNFEEKRAIVAYDATVLDVEDLTRTVTTTGGGETYKVSDMKTTTGKMP